MASKSPHSCTLDFGLFWSKELDALSLAMSSSDIKTLITFCFVLFIHYEFFNEFLDQICSL